MTDPAKLQQGSMPTDTAEALPLPNPAFYAAWNTSYTGIRFWTPSARHAAEWSRDNGIPTTAFYAADQVTSALTAQHSAPSAEPAADLRKKLIDAIADGLGSALHCNRVWSAWNVGTMSESDFSSVAESDTPAELADAVLAIIGSAPAAQASQPASPHIRALISPPAVVSDTATFADLAISNSPTIVASSSFSDRTPWTRLQKTAQPTSCGCRVRLIRARRSIWAPAASRWAARPSIKAPASRRRRPSV